MRVLITGVAGFIGSNLAGKLLSKGHSVTGVDSITQYYPESQKRFALAKLSGHKNFTFHEHELAWPGLEKAIGQSDIVFHLAAQPGVLHSWGENFNVYLKNNVQATQHLLEILKYHTDIPMIFASSSSVYGKTDKIPMKEDNQLNPISPYGLTKLTCEKLLELYSEAWDIKFLSLRFFTVFGPGQRPDMAFHKFLKAAHMNEEINIYGDGSQRRDFTYIETLTNFLGSLLDNSRWGIHLNIGGGNYITVSDAVEIIREISGKSLEISYGDTQKGDMKETLADISQAKEYFNYHPDFSVREGLEEQWKWIKSYYG